MHNAHAEVRGTALVLTAADGAVRAIEIDSPEWFAWLAEDANRAFRYVTPVGALSVRKERRARGMWYWSAYRRVGGRLRKHYLGRSSELASDRLAVAARALGEHQTHPAPDAPAACRSIAPALIPTKLAPPLIGTHIVARPRLIDRIRATGPGRLTLVQAPAGSGKTTLLASLVDRQAPHTPQQREGDDPRRLPLAPPRSASPPERLAWLSLDPADNDPTRFWRYVFAALAGALPTLGAALPLLQSASSDDIGEIAVAALVRQLDIRATAVTLVLDDYHVVAHPAIHAALARLLEHLPHTLHLVVASRSEPPLPLARLRVRGLLHEIRAADLAFRIEEAKTLFADAEHDPLADQELAVLVARTEGWAAGLRLAAIARAEGDPWANRGVSEVGDTQHLFSYLIDEVFRQQPVGVQRFLLATCVADRLCAPLCGALVAAFTGHLDEHVSGVAEAPQDLLAAIEHQGLFLTALDRERRWFRYHQLFAGFLRQLLDRLHPERVPVLHRRAGAWFAEHHFIAEAVTSLVAGGAADAAAALVETHAEQTLWEQYDPPTVRAWLAALPPATVQSRWRLLIAEILTSLNGAPAQIEAAVAPRIEALLRLVPPGPLREAWLRGEPPPAATPEDSETRTLLGQLAFIRLNHDRLVNHGQQYAALAPFAEAWLGEQPSVFAPTMAGTNAITAFFRGEVRAAAESYARMQRLALTLGNPPTVLASMIGVASVQYASGAVAPARLGLEQALRYAQAHDIRSSTSVAMARARLGQLLYAHNDLAAARPHLEAALALPWEWWEPESALPAALTLALTYVACGETVRVTEPLDQLEQLAQLGHYDAVAAIVSVCRAQVSVRQRDLSGAAQIVADLGVAGLRSRYASAFLVLRELADFALARALIAAGRASEAAEILISREQEACAQGRHRSCWEVRVLLALAHDACGDRKAALARLAVVIPAIAGAQLVRLLVDEGPAAAALVAAAEGSFVGGQRLQPHVDRLLAAFPAAELPTRTPHLPRLEPELESIVEPISEREQAVLQLLAAGATTREIARDLVIAESTVKWHVRNLCGKLQVRTRLQLVARARALGLLP